jgi:hypothetical protein
VVTMGGTPMPQIMDTHFRRALLSSRFIERRVKNAGFSICSPSIPSVVASSESSTIMGYRQKRKDGYCVGARQRGCRRTAFTLP